MSLKIQILSDLHLDRHRDHGREFVNSLDGSGVDALIIAGDLADVINQRSITGEWILPALCDKYEKVLYVVGNHEYWGASFESAQEFFAQREEQLENLTWMHRKVVEIKGRRILGCTMWFPVDTVRLLLDHRAASDGVGMNDFVEIVDFVENIQDQSSGDYRFLKENMQEGDVVVTHHIPSRNGLDPLYKFSDLNRFFVTPCEVLTIEKKPSMWIHGHTHHKSSYEMEPGVQVHCNPLGYPHQALNIMRFDNKMILEP